MFFNTPPCQRTLLACTFADYWCELLLLLPTALDTRVWLKTRHTGDVPLWKCLCPWLGRVLDPCPDIAKVHFPRVEAMWESTDFNQIGLACEWLRQMPFDQASQLGDVYAAADFHIILIKQDIYLLMVWTQNLQMSSVGRGHNWCGTRQWEQNFTTPKSLDSPVWHVVPSGWIKHVFSLNGICVFCFHNSFTKARKWRLSFLTRQML